MYYLVLDDIAVGAPKEYRDDFREGLPSTVPIFTGNGVKGALRLPKAWMDYVVKINGITGCKYQFMNSTNNTVFRPAVGWHNQGASNLVEQVTFSGNIVDVYEIVGNRAYIRCYYANQKPPTEIITPMPNNLHPLVQLFSTQYYNRLDMTVDGKYPRALIIARDESEKLWIDLRNLKKVVEKENDMLIGYDYWEGNPDIDETQITGIIKYLIPRLNDMNGGHHMDQLFTKHWAEAKNFLRFFYFVYNPWKKGLDNWNWMKANMPKDSPPRFAVDIEVKYPGYSSSAYAQEVYNFISLAIADGMRPVVYTGNWFLEYLSSWRSDVDYWWARYPDLANPVTSPSTFQQLADRMNPLVWNPGIAPGPVKLWQVSEKWLLPGSGGHAVDINLWNGTYQELTDWIGGITPPVVPPVGDCHTAELIAELQTKISELQLLANKYK
jgi:GH25 family lysozyme M1 (1,4-beta-N-acetylmuramidase)